MVLGTVEIGMKYGINNAEGKPTDEQAFKLLDEAWNGGIFELDTANAYGDSENIIGRYQKEKERFFLIDTKLPVEEDIDRLEKGFEDSCRKLNTESINVLYLHSFKQCQNSEIIKLLEKLKDENKIKHIGVSIYTPDEMEFILDNIPIVDTIQFPFNILDCHRWIDSGLISRAKQNNKRLYVRSVFLQGLIFKSASDDFITSVKGEEYINNIHSLSENLGMSVAELAYKYVQNTAGIKEIIIGCQNADEVKRNLLMQDNDKSLSSEIIEEIHSFTENIPAKIIDPREW